MGKTLQRLASFIMFDIQITLSYNKLLLHKIHRQNSLIFEGWNIEGTKQKLVSYYWYTHVCYHFLSILAIPMVVALLSSGGVTLLGLSVLLLFSLVTLLIAYFFIYLPLFLSIYLPHIETLVAQRRKNPLETPQTKSARTQSKIPALTIIIHTLFKVSGIQTISCNDQSAKLINALTGVDNGSIKENLRRIYKPTSLTPKERAEMLKGIMVGRKYFHELGHSAALEILNQLQDKIDR